MDNISLDIYRAIYAALESRLHLIGSVIESEASRLTINEKIMDKGDFYANIGYLVSAASDGLTLRVGSNVRHEPFVLGGKVPSWTPIAPLISWVQRKGLAWVDKITGDALSVSQIAHIIQRKIRREGIAPRNVFETVLKNREQWIYQQLNSIEVSL